MLKYLRGIADDDGGLADVEFLGVQLDLSSWFVNVDATKVKGVSGRRYEE